MFQKFLFRTWVGFMVGCAVGCLVSELLTYGSAAEFLLGLLMIVVCTFGLGLLVVIPAAYLIGLAVTIRWVPFGKTAWTRKEEEERRRLTAGAGMAPPPEPSPAPGGSDPLATMTGSKPQDAVDRALLEYTRKATAVGTSRQVIEEELRRAGWQDDRIRGAFRMAGLK